MGNDLLRFGIVSRLVTRLLLTMVLAMGKQHFGSHVVVGYGIKIFKSGLFITSPDHLEEEDNFSRSFRNAVHHGLSSKFENVRQLKPVQEEALM